MWVQCVKYEEPHMRKVVLLVNHNLGQKTHHEDKTLHEKSGNDKQKFQITECPLEYI